jgi:ABC-type multidrug transport system ATPase subunit
MIILNCQKITIQAGYRTLLSDFSFSFLKGKSYAVVGKNGLGKTSLLKILAGISRPYQGEVFCFEEMLFPKRQIQHEHTSFFLSNTPSLLLDHTVMQNLMFFVQSFCLDISHTPGEFIISQGLSRGAVNKSDAHISKYARRPSCSGNEELGPVGQQILKKVGLEKHIHQSARSLSTGQKRRLTLAGIFAVKPAILIADEPTNGLDDEGQDLFLSLLKEMQKEHQTTSIIATHDPTLIHQCDEVIPLANFIPHSSRARVGPLFL